MTALDVARPVPHAPGPRRTVDVLGTAHVARQLQEVADGLAHRGRPGRSSQALDTALMELGDAAIAHRALCPLVDAPDLDAGDTVPVTVRVRALAVRLADAVIRAEQAGATLAEIEAAKAGYLR